MLPPYIAARSAAARQDELIRSARTGPSRRPARPERRRVTLARPMGHLLIAVGLRLLARDASALLAR